MDLSPREVVPTAAGRKRKRPWLSYGVLVLVLAMGGIVVAKFLTSAVDYYCNVDEVGVKSGCDVGRTIRIQGVVDKRTIRSQGSASTFLVEWKGQKMTVNYEGEASGLFADLVNPKDTLDCLPVVISGVVVKAPDGTVSFNGNNVLAKHDNSYDAANKDRISQSNAEAASCSQKA